MTRSQATTTWTGLAARSWDALGGNEPQEDHAYLLALLRARGGRSLDVGCGTGRLLVRFLSEGLDVDGLDTSCDMLRICRSKAEATGRAPALFERSMEDPGDSGPYRTILIPCGSFMLLLDDARAIGALRSMRERLTDDGLLWFNTFSPSQRPRPTIGTWQRRAEGELPDGSRVVMDVVVEEHDEERCVVRARRRYTRSRGDEVLEVEDLDDAYRWRSPDAVHALVAEAGFQTVTVHGDYDGGPVGEHSSVATFTAER